MHVVGLAKKARCTATGSWIGASHSITYACAKDYILCCRGDIVWTSTILPRAQHASVIVLNTICSDKQYSIMIDQTTEVSGASIALTQTGVEDAAVSCTHRWGWGIYRD